MKSPGFTQQVLFLSVSDLDTSSKFYGDTLGLRLARDQGTCRIYHIAGSSFIGVCRGTPSDMPNGVTITLVSDDVDGWHSNLMERDVNIRSSPRFNEKYQIYHFYLQDPDGYTIEIQRFKEPLK